MSLKKSETLSSGFISEFEGLRGLLAIWVVIGHTLSGLSVSSFLSSPNLWNTVPVQIFIILSGFVIFSLLDREHPPYRTFIMQRAFRLFPAYLVALAISALMLPFARDVLLNTPSAPMTATRIALIDVATSDFGKHFAAHIFLIQGLIPENVLTSSAYTLIGQAWSVSVEWQFYVLAPLVFFLIGIEKRGYKIPLLAVLISLLITLNSKLGGGYVGQHLSLFAVGIATFYAKKHQSKLMPSAYIPALFALPFMWSYAAALIIWIMISYCAISHKKNATQQLISKILIAKPILHLGKISYSIYINHMIFVFLALYTANILNTNTAGTLLITIFLSTASTIIFSHATYSYIEKPMIKFGKKLSKKNFTQPLFKI